MAKRGYKLQEFVAHSSNVNCLSIGKKACRLFLTGGDDNKVNLWSIGKPNSLMSLCGHTSPVESVAFDATEVMVLGGASSGVIKLWDLEEAKMVRGLTGHRSNCTAVEFHPFGEFFASGSTDTNLKIWDIRKKGCIHTYKGHTRGIGTIKFTPDGRWVVSGGCDSVVKVWDLTAGKLLHDFKFHENHIRSIHFHPLEFLMATGSADRTVKYWDLETFELIGSSRPEGSSVRAITFHPDGRTLFCGLEDSLKVYSWEPVVCHDTVDMGWSSLGDLCIHEGKLVGCSYYQNSVGVWAADTTLIEPFAKGSTGHQVNLPVSHSPAKVESGLCASPNYEAKEIKNIYVDTSDGKPVSLQRAGSVYSSKVLMPPDLKDNRNLAAENPRQGPGTTSPEKSNDNNKSLVVPNFVTPDGSDERDTPHSQKDSVSFSRTKPGMLLRPAPSRRPSGPKYSIDRLTIPTESPDIIGTNSLSDCHLERNSESRDTPENAVGLSSEGRLNNMKTVSRTMPPVEIPKAEKESAITTQDAGRESSKEKIPRITNRITPVKMTKVEKGDEPVAQRRESDSVKIVRGVSVMTGRTRTLVEKFEKRERLSIVEEQGVNVSSTLTSVMDSSPASRVDAVERKENSISHENHGVNVSSSASTTLSPLTPTMDSTPASRVDALEIKENSISHENHGFNVSSSASTTLSALTTTMDSMPASRVDAVERKENSISHESHGVSVSSNASTTLNRTAVAAVPLAKSLRRRDGPTVTPTTDNSPTSQVDVVERKGNSSSAKGRGLSIPSSTSTTTEMAPVTTVSLAESYKRRDRSTIKVQSIVVVPDVPRVTPSSNEKLVHDIKVMEERGPACGGNRPNIMPRNAYIEPVQSNEPQVSGRMESYSETFADVIEVLMQSHEVFLSTLRSRLTKLKAVLHFWERKDMKGAINALKRLPDHSVQADVISVLTEKMEILNLDLFSCLLPMLVGLLDSKIERHAVLSMEMLMKLVAVFGPVVRSTISARPTVGIDLHAEERLECCNQCWAQLQKTQEILPLLVRRGGLLAKSAQELNLVLQQS